MRAVPSELWVYLCKFLALPEVLALCQASRAAYESVLVPGYPRAFLQSRLGAAGCAERAFWWGARLALRASGVSPEDARRVAGAVLRGGSGDEWRALARDVTRGALSGEPEHNPVVVAVQHTRVWDERKLSMICELIPYAPTSTLASVLACLVGGRGPVELVRAVVSVPGLTFTDEVKAAINRMRSRATCWALLEAGVDPNWLVVRAVQLSWADVLEQILGDPRVDLSRHIFQLDAALDASARSNVRSFATQSLLLDRADFDPFMLTRRHTWQCPELLPRIVVRDDYALRADYMRDLAYIGRKYDEGRADELFGMVLDKVGALTKEEQLQMSFACHQIYTTKHPPWYA